MPEYRWSKTRLGRAASILSRVIAALFCILLLLVLALKFYLSTPLAAAQLSRLLTTHLHQPVMVTRLHTEGFTLYLTGLSLGNPSGFQAGNLAGVDSIAIAPQWLEILLGKRSFRLIALEGVRLDMLKDSKGVWNFSPLQQLLSAGKPSPVETFIGQLVIKNGALQVNGQGVNGIALQVFNLATKGSADSRIALTFEDSARNRYQIEGKAHPGNDPAFDISLTAPSLSLDRFARILKLKNAPALKGGSGQLRVNAELRKGLFRVRGDLEFSRLSVPLAQGRSTLTGRVSVAADYNLHTDEARLESLALSVNNLMQAKASGTVADLRHERRFRFDLSVDQIDLGTLALFLPESERRKMVPGGTLDGKSIRLSGNGSRGVTSASGSLLLKNGSLIRDGRLMVSGLDGSLSLSGTEKGFVAKGRFSRRQTSDKALLEKLDAPIEISLSSRMKPLMVEVPTLSAKIMGVQMAGHLAFREAAAEPFTLSLRIPATATASINPLLEKLELHFLTGTTSLTLDVAGRGLRDFSAMATTQLSSWKLSKGKQKFTLKQGSIDSRLILNGGKLTASGKARLTGLAMGGQPGDARCSYQFADGMVTLSDAAFQYGDASATIARLTARIPIKETGAGTIHYPISLGFSGTDIQQGKMVLNTLSGTLSGNYTSGANGRWLEGTAKLAASGSSWQGKTLGAPAANLIFSKTGGKGKVSGSLLGGKLNGEVAFNPFAPQDGGAFQLEIKGVSLTKAAEFIPRSGGVTLADGQLDASLDGGYSRQEGIKCRFASRGNGISLTGNSGKTILAKGGVGLTGAISGQNVTISDAVLSAGEGVMLKVKGEVANAFSSKRKGSLTFTLPEVSVNSLIDPIANILPRYLQEATLYGSVAAEARFDLHDGRELLNGSLLLKKVGLDLPSQSFTTADITGTLPFSLDFSGEVTARPADALSFSRQNYPRLLEQFRQAQSAGPAITVGKLRFGPLELGTLAMHVTAGNGITEITALHTSLYQGDLFGKAYVTAKPGLHYRGDLLVNDLSLIQFCNAIPKIKGYISGRLDGIVSLSGEGTGKEALLGFTEFWTRSGSGEKMHVSREFLQKLAGKKLQGFFFRKDRSYDQAEIKAILKGGNLTFEALDILHTSLFGIRDLSVTVAPASNRISLDRLFSAIKQAQASGKAVSSDKGPAEAPIETQFKWLE